MFIFMDVSKGSEVRSSIAMSQDYYRLAKNNLTTKSISTVPVLGLSNVSHVLSLQIEFVMEM